MTLSIPHVRDSNTEQPPVPRWLLDAAPSVTDERAAYESALATLRQARNARAAAFTAVNEATILIGGRAEPHPDVATDTWRALRKARSDAELAEHRAAAAVSTAWTKLSDAVQDAPDAVSRAAQVRAERIAAVQAAHAALASAYSRVTEVDSVTGAVYLDGNVNIGSRVGGAIRDLGTILNGARP